MTLYKLALTQTLPLPSDFHCYATFIIQSNADDSSYVCMFIVLSYPLCLRSGTAGAAPAGPRGLPLWHGKIEQSKPYCTNIPQSRMIRTQYNDSNFNWNNPM